MISQKNMSSSGDNGFISQDKTRKLTLLEKVQNLFLFLPAGDPVDFLMSFLTVPLPVFLSPLLFLNFSCLSLCLSYPPVMYVPLVIT